MRANSPTTSDPSARLHRANTFPRSASFLLSQFIYNFQVELTNGQGSCKFGQNCALAHILQDGRMVNKAPPPRATNVAQQRRVGHLNAGLQHSPTAPFLPSQGSHDHYGPSDHQDSGLGYPGHPTSPSVRLPQHNAEPYSPFGSPHASQLPTSPARVGLSALDAPLPGSFDSQGISLAARNGPYASSVPPRFGFGFESPPSSLPNKYSVSNMPLRDVREVDFGDTNNLDGVLHGLGTSPQSNEPMSFNKRPLHAERLAASGPLLSSALDTRPSRLVLEQNLSDDESDDGVGEDLLPSSLHDLLPQDKLRRPSRSAVDDLPSGFFGTSPRRGFSSSNNTPIERPGNLSPLASSPSRYSAMWAARPSGPRKPENDPAGSAFGHVGSPLRPSALRTSSLVGSTSPVASFSPRMPGKSGPSNLSILTKELQRSRLTDKETATQSPLSLLATQNMNRDEQNARAEHEQVGLKGTIEAGQARGTDSANGKPEEEVVFSMEDEDGRRVRSKASDSEAPDTSETTTQMTSLDEAGK